MLGRRKEKPEEKAVSESPAVSPTTRTTPTEPRTEPAPVAHRRLGDLLLDANLINQKELDDALAIQKQRGGFIGQILVQLGYIKQEAVASCLVKQCKIPHLSLLDYDIGPDVLSLIPEAVCRKYNLLPIDKLGRILTVAMVDPLDLDALEEIRAVCPDLRIKPILCNWEHFELVASKVFGKGRRQEGTEEITAASLGLGSAVKKKPENGAPESAPPAQAKTVEMAPATPAAVLAGAEKGLAGSSSEELLGLMRESIRETAVAIAQELRNTKSAAMPTGEELSHLIRDSVGGAIQEALATAVVQLRANAAQEKTPAPQMEQLMETIRESVSGAMQEALATMVVQMRAMAGRRESATITDKAGAASLSPEALGDILKESVREALSASREAQAAQEARLAQIAEAALQSVQQASQFVEGRAVAGQNQRDIGGGRSGRHASVAPFGRGLSGKEAAAAAEAHAEEDDQVLAALESEHPLETLTFDTFFPGSANAFTAKLGQAVAASPGGEYNPFFLYGNVGTGKTHLISAIGNAIQEKQQKARVGYVSASHFARRLADAAREDALDAFRENYCHWDVLILDDIQFMGGRVEAQEEFFHIFNVLHQQSRQIIIASDKAPDRLGLLEQRLVSRFASGIVADLKAPERETRMQILRHQVKEAKVTVPDEILSLIAMRVTNDVRKMMGSLRKIIAYARLVGQEMSCEMADEILNHLGIEQAA